MENRRPYEKVGAVLKLKCPNCGKAKVFHRARFPFKGPVMKDTCEACGYNFDRDPSYFRGAMYLSYGLALAEGLIVFLVVRYMVFGITTTNLVLITLAAVMFCAMWNYKMARVIWMNIFPD